MQQHHVPSSTAPKKEPAVEGTPPSFPDSLVLPDRAAISLNSPSQRGSQDRSSTQLTLIDEITSEKVSWWQPLAESYFQIRAIEANGTVYKALGVQLFKKLVMSTVGRYKMRHRETPKDAGNYFIGGHAVEELKGTVESTQFNEAVHLTGLVFGNIPALALALKAGEVPGILNTTAFLVNAYCIMLQRYNRERLLKVIKRAETDLSTRMQRVASETDEKVR